MIATFPKNYECPNLHVPTQSHDKIEVMYKQEKHYGYNLAGKRNLIIIWICTMKEI